MSRYPYLYETHLHTNWGSRCSYASPKEMVRVAKEKGYTGIFITEHNWGGNCHIDKEIDWPLWLKYYTRGYEDAKAEGEKIGLQVFWAYEAGFNFAANQKGTEMLVYGLSPDFLAQHPEIRDLDILAHNRFVRENGGMVIHAHPYREASYIPEIRLYPDCVDGVEAFNASHYPGREMFDPPALAYAHAHGLPITAGSDAHITEKIRGGIATREKLECPQDYCRLIKENGDYILTNGLSWFDKQGEPVER